MTAITQEKLCKNCGNSFTEKFCNRCGQKEAHRLTIPHVFHDLVHVFLHADKGIFPFIWRLLAYPGTMAREFVDGKRRMFNPFQYLILSVGVVVFLMIQSQFFESIQDYNNASTGRLSAHMQKAMQDYNLFMKKYVNVITFMSLPIYAFFSWLFFRKRRENYAEHFTIQVFSMCQVNTLIAIAVLVVFIFRLNYMVSVWISIVLVILSYFITYKQFFSLRWPKALWKAILIFGLSYGLQVILSGIGLIVYALSIKK